MLITDLRVVSTGFSVSALLAFGARKFFDRTGTAVLCIIGCLASSVVTKKKKKKKMLQALPHV